MKVRTKCYKSPSEKLSIPCKIAWQSWFPSKITLYVDEHRVIPKNNSR